jgi:hypothetical protein
MIEAALGDMSDLWRRAREFGDFVDVGGLIYPEFERCVVPKPPEPRFVRSLMWWCSIDPGIRNAGIVWQGFDGDNVIGCSLSAVAGQDAGGLREGDP